MSQVENLKAKLSEEARKAQDLIRELQNRKRAVDEDRKKVSELLGGSSTDVDKAMVAAIDGAVDEITSAIRELGSFAACANVRAGRL